MSDVATLKKQLAQLHAVQAWCLKSEAAPRINAMIDLSRSEPNIPILPEQLDRDGWLLNCPNGTLELRSGKLREHRQADYITQLCKVAYDANATCPTWELFLAQIFQENRELIGYVQRLLGCCLTGDVSEQYLWIFWGTGANGKSTLLNIILELLGADYAMKAPVDFLMAKSGNSHPTDKADLFRKRLVCCVESGEGKKLDETLIKELTGGDRIRARRMREDYWEFEPTHKVILCTNHKPTIKGTDHAIWRRVRLIPFVVTIPDDRQDKGLIAKLRAELPGILAWCVRGFLAWQQSGMGLPDAVKMATDSYRAEQSILDGFLADCCLVGPAYRCRASQFYAAFVAWCKSTGEADGAAVPSQRKIGQAVSDKGIAKETSNGRWYVGVAVRQDDESQEG